MHAWVASVHLDGAKEFHGDEAKQWFEGKGISIQETAAYSHQQNGKAKRHVRVIKNDAMTMLVNAGLPMQFLG